MTHLTHLGGDARQGGDARLTRQMLVDDAVTLPDLYDGATQRFRRGAIREEMVRRGIRRAELLSWSAVSPATLRRAMAGQSVKDTWAGYRGLEKRGYTHDRRSERAATAAGEDPGELMPAGHRVISLAKRWLLGTHQGSVEDAHLHSYLDEFVFRFNRRTSRSRGLVFFRVLELAVAHEPVRHQDLIARKRPRAVPPVPARPGGHPPSLERPPANRPWRTG